jgi:hypothetical protein
VAIAAELGEIENFMEKWGDAEKDQTVPQHPHLEEKTSDVASRSYGCATIP